MSAMSCGACILISPRAKKRRGESQPAVPDSAAENTPKCTFRRNRLYRLPTGFLGKRSKSKQARRIYFFWNTFCFGPFSPVPPVCEPMFYHNLIIAEHTNPRVPQTVAFRIHRVMSGYSCSSGMTMSCACHSNTKQLPMFRGQRIRYFV